MNWSNLSYAEKLALATPEKRREIIAEIGEARFAAFSKTWAFWARPKQLPPAGDWFVWFLRPGRGWGKNRTAAEWVNEQVIHHGVKSCTLVARSWKEVERFMINGDSGIVSVAPADNKPIWREQKKLLIWPKQQAIAYAYTADEPDSLRGPNTEIFWADEIASWGQQQAAWDNLMFTCRKGNTRGVVTTTPTPTPVVQELHRRSIGPDPDVVEVTGSSYDNKAHLSKAFYRSVIAPVEGTRLGRQEVHGEILGDVPGALWTEARLDANRVRPGDVPPEFQEIVVGVDPAVTDPQSMTDERVDETGIVVAGRQCGHGFTLEDATARLSTSGWAQRTVETFWKWKADRVVAEKNNGGDLVKHNIQAVDPRVPVDLVWASRGKYKRAEPVATLDEQGRCHHVGRFPALEAEQQAFVPGGGFIKSPNRADAYVWAIWALLIEPQQMQHVDYGTMIEERLISPV